MQCRTFWQWERMETELCPATPKKANIPTFDIPACYRFGCSSRENKPMHNFLNSSTFKTFRMYNVYTTTLVPSVKHLSWDELNLLLQWIHSPNLCAAVFVMLDVCSNYYLAADLVFATGCPNWCNVLMQRVRRPCTTQYDPIMFSRKEWDALTLQTFWIPAREHWWGWAVQVIRWGQDQETNVATWFYSGPQFQLSRSRYPQGWTVSLVDFEANCFIALHHASHSNSNAHDMESERFRRVWIGLQHWLYESEWHNKVGNFLSLPIQSTWFPDMPVQGLSNFSGGERSFPMEMLPVWLTVGFKLGSEFAP